MVTARYSFRAVKRAGPPADKGTVVPLKAGMAALRNETISTLTLPGVGPTEKIEDPADGKIWSAFLGMRDEAMTGSRPRNGHSAW